MVDFNNDTTVSTPPGEVVKIVVLERREQVIEALESYHMADASHADVSNKLIVLQARVMAFWYQIQAIVYRRLGAAKKGDKTYNDIELEITGAETFDELRDAFLWMNVFVDDLGLTFIDGRPRYDRQRVEDSNFKKGM